MSHCLSHQDFPQDSLAVKFLLPEDASLLRTRWLLLLLPSPTVPQSRMLLYGFHLEVTTSPHEAEVDHGWSVEISKDPRLEFAELSRRRGKMKSIQDMHVASIRILLQWSTWISLTWFVSWNAIFHILHMKGVVSDPISPWLFVASITSMRSWLMRGLRQSHSKDLGSSVWHPKGTVEPVNA